MLQTKEELQAQIDIICRLEGEQDIETSVCLYWIRHLKEQLKQAKSIADLQKEAFEAGINLGENIEFGKEYLGLDTEFEIYLKTIKR